MKAKRNSVKKYVGGGAVVGGAIQGGLGLAQTIYGGIQANRARKELERVRASAPVLETPSEYMKLYKEAFNNQMLERQMESIRSAAGSSIGALGQAGGRALLGGIQDVARQSAEQSQQAVDKQQLRQMGALQQLGAANERTMQMKEGRFQNELGMAQGFYDAALQNIASGIGAMGKGAMYAFSEKKKTGEEGGGEEGGGEDFKKGGVIKTDGKFSHEDNPIHMVQDGEKVGEMTGGEYIFNPEQMSKIKTLSKSSPERLTKYIRSLIKKFEKK